MILGSISFPITENTDSVIEDIRSFIDKEENFHPVSQPGFSGGYFMNLSLPLKSGDLYYADLINDIIVLLSGFVYNKSELLDLYFGEHQLSEPELIAEMFLKDGPQFVEKLNGDFAFLIYRPVKGESYLFRDHVGIRPLGWIINKNSLFFSTEIPGLCRAFSRGNNIDSDYLPGYLKYIDYKKTPNKDVRKLPPGHYLRFSEKDCEITKYWCPEKIRTDRKLQYDTMLTELKSILTDSVKIRSDSRFIAGSHVSGGIDSGIVSLLARNNFQHQEKFYGFSWSPADFTAVNEKYDERDLVIRFCRETNIELLFSTLNYNEFNQLLSSYYRNHGFFSEDSTSEQAAGTKTNLIFSGWGGDEFISTGDRGIELDLLRRLKFKQFFKRNPLKRPVKLLRYLFLFVVYPAAGILDRATAKSFKEEARYLRKSFKRSDKKAIASFYFHTSRHQLHLNMLKFYHLQERCETWTVMGYRKGIEYRYPLLDKRIIEYMLKVPTELLCQTDSFRPLLREICKGILPEEVRLNTDKSDPVYWLWMHELFRNSALHLMDEVSSWKTNADLHFIDFNLLEKEIQEFRNNRLKIEEKILFRALVYIKGMYEFSVKYHEEM
jgi:asparagine synthase (glutamine-hydrolysing)